MALHRDGVINGPEPALFLLVLAGDGPDALERQFGADVFVQAVVMGE